MPTQEVKSGIDQNHTVRIYIMHVLTVIFKEWIRFQYNHKYGNFSCDSI